MGNVRIAAPTRVLSLLPARGEFIPIRDLWALVNSKAGCAYSGLDPDAWFPVSASVDQARREASAALAVCAACQVRRQCLELSLRQWRIGQHGIWGGLLPAEREPLRSRLVRRGK
jgi:Transcription factor WhiB